jgi:hypothetical protein
MSRTRVPECTNNRSLAIALHMGGARIIRIWRVYSTPELERLGMNAATATIKGIGGSAKYFIEPTDEMKALEAAHDEMAKADPVEIPAVSNVDAAKIATLALKLRAEIEKELRDPANAYVIDERGQPIHEEKNGEHHFRHPGLSMHSANASDSTKDHLKQ